MWFWGEDDLGEPAGEVREAGDPAADEEVGELDVDNLGFVDAIAWWSAGDRFSIAGVNAKFIIENGSADAFGGEGVPVILDDRGKAVSVVAR